MKKVLFITHHTLVGKGGGVFATRAFIHAFSILYPGLTVVYPAGEEKETLNMYDCKLIPVTYNIPKWLKFIHLLLGKVHRYFSLFEKILKTGEYDLVVFDNSRASYRLIDVAHSYAVKVVTIHHNFELEYNRDNHVGIVKYLLLFWTYRYEKQAILKSDLNLVLTAYDKKELSKQYGNKNNIDVLGCFEFRESSETKNVCENYIPISKFVITGNLSARQTEESMNRWFEKFYPILEEEAGKHSLIIAGKKPSECFIKKCKSFGIDVISSPVSIDSIVRKSLVYICPISLGGGIKLRVMDGLRLGVPVIAHEISSRGYEAFVEKGYMFVYNDIETFRESLRRICEVSIKKEDIISLYQHVFSFESGVIRLKLLLEAYNILG